MKLVALFIALLFLLSYFTGMGQQKMKEVNAVVHDDSYIAYYGALPGAAANEQERVQLHLLYAEQLLRNVDLSHLTDDQRANRDRVLDLLNQYAINGIFPTNRDYPGERKPCFIDADGAICAVGYLVEQTKGRRLAEQINAKHQYDFLSDMNEPAIKEWADAYGLTLEECAIIQPTYGPPPPSQTAYADIKTGYGVSSGLAGGANIAITIVNLSNRFQHNTRLSYLGLVTGTTQVVLGFANVKRSKNTLAVNGGETYTSYKAQNNLSYVNIAMGTTTLITSVLNIAMQKKIRDKRNAFNLYSYPTYSNAVAMGLSFTRKI